MTPEVTVEDLIHALSVLPSDTKVREIGPGGDAPVSRGKWCEFHLLRKDSEMILYIVDHNATYPDLEDDWEPLL